MLCNAQDSLLIQNFSEFWLDISKQPGFEIYQSQGILALKAPVKMPGAHFVFGPITPQSIKAVKTFFDDYPFGWLSQFMQPHEEKWLEKEGFSKPILFPEMSLDLQTITSTSWSSVIKIHKIDKNNLNLFEQWVEVASQTFEIPKNIIQEFTKATLNIPRQQLYLAVYNDQPVGTASVYFGRKAAGLYHLSVAKPFRRKGVGRAITYTCLEHIRQVGHTKTVLFPSEMAFPLYTSIGFRIIHQHTLYQYCKSPTSYE